MRRLMTTTSPLIRRLGSGYCASWNGFYLYDEDLQRVLSRVAEIMEGTNPGESRGEDPIRDRAAAEPELTTAD